MYFYFLNNGINDSQRSTILSQAVILNFLPDMIFAVNGGTGRITFCSGKVTKILLHSEESLLASSFYSLMLPHSVPIIKRLISNTLRTNEKEGKGIRGAKEARDVSDMSSSSIARSNSPSSNDSSNALHNDALNNSSLNRNVLAHKSAMNDKQGAKGNGDDLKDDVNGEKVTRNNANARLSSLRFREKEGRGKKRDREGKSRGREEETRELSSEVGSSEGNLADEEDGSFPSREDSGESFTGEINGATSGEQKILSSCKVCLIRKDMSTVWCEATFNARLLEKEVVGQEGAAADDNNNGQRKKGERKNVKKEDGGEEPVVEYLFSLRPIRDGELAPEELRLTVKEDECSHSSSDRTNPVTTTSTSNSTSASNPPSPTPNSPVTGSVNSPARRRDRLKSVKGLVKAVGGTEEKELSVIEGLLTLTGRK